MSTCYIFGLGYSAEDNNYLETCCMRILEINTITLNDVPTTDCSGPRASHLMPKSHTWPLGCRLGTRGLQECMELGKEKVRSKTARKCWISVWMELPNIQGTKNCCRCTNSSIGYFVFLQVILILKGNNNVFKIISKAKTCFLLVLIK